APRKSLLLSGRPLLIIADHYDSLDGMIDGRGANSTAPGAQGTNGRSPGLIGDRPAGPGTSVTLLCRTATNVHVRTTGGNGGRGGRGVDGFFVFSGDPENPGDEIVPGTRGGFGGPGGSGGDGGVGGELVFVSEQAPEAPVLVAGGGLGGPGGSGGQAGGDSRGARQVATPGGGTARPA